MEVQIHIEPEKQLLKLASLTGIPSRVKPRVELPITPPSQKEESKEPPIPSPEPVPTSEPIPTPAPIPELYKSEPVPTETPAPVPPPITEAGKKLKPKLKPKKPKLKPKKPKYSAWKSGTGFGHQLDAKDWDINTFVQQRGNTDSEILTILDMVLSGLKGSLDAPKIDMESLIVNSCVVPFCKEYLSNDSLLDIVQNHSKLYTRILELISEVTKHTDLLPLFLDRCQAPSTNRALIDILSDLADKCHFAYKMGGDLMKPEDAGEKETPTVKPKAGGPPPPPVVPAPVPKQATSAVGVAPAPGPPPPPPVVKPPKKNRRRRRVGEKVAPMDAHLPRLIIDTHKLASDRLEEYKQKTSYSAGSEVEVKTEESEVDHRKEYMDFLKNNCFEATSDESFMATHHYKSQSKQSTKKQIMRLGCEFANLVKSCPIEWESSILLAVEENKMQFAKFMVIPPDDTPYASGCFIFDVYFPSTYPNVPPKVNLMTTGGGSVRFNPNLYNCGKVCLSLLGTWSAQTQGEKWNPKVSTFLQVLVSIQSLVFVPQPYYNEPSYEREMNTPSGDTKSEAYSLNIRKQTVRWAMIDQLKNPPKCYEKVIREHFRLQKDRVLKNATDWLGKDASAVKELSELLDKNMKMKSEETSP